jgi:hypothetical protein
MAQQLRHSLAQYGTLKLVRTRKTPVFRWFSPLFQLAWRKLHTIRRR